MVRKFTIKKGSHYSKPPSIRVHFGITKIKFRFKFDKDCYYHLDDASIDPDDHDINKLYGFSFLYHHWESIRIGWLPSIKFKDMIELYRYIYNHGRRIPDYTPMATIKTEVWYEATIELNTLLNTVLFVIKESDSGLGICTSSTSYDAPKIRWGYKLDFHFGGDYVAPNDMCAYIEELRP